MHNKYLLPLLDPQDAVYGHNVKQPSCTKKVLIYCSCASAAPSSSRSTGRSVRRSSSRTPRP